MNPQRPPDWQQYPAQQHLPHQGQLPVPYPSQGYEQQPLPSRPTNVMAVVSFVLAFVFAPLAVPFGHIARKQIRERGEGGDVFAVIGLVIGYVGLALVIALLGGAFFLFGLS